MENGDRAKVTILTADPAVRQTLKTAIESAGFRTTTDGEQTDSLATLIVETPGVIALAELEQRAIEQALRVTGGRVAKAARLLGIGRATLYRRLAARQPVAPPANVTPPEPRPTSIH